jgi:hypothetical protein
MGPMAGTWSHPDALVTWSSRSAVVGQVLAYVRTRTVPPPNAGNHRVRPLTLDVYIMLFIPQ